ncbi:hypothetical protein Y032_0717g1792 [Ancylostoma ceylanicum]|uniref:Uncharacterized protein n=1 Tax=Ancylostoma ceylanicum TaxID=53326 RepID=A0A016WGM3_9BILA|nr:hypothetical protein Y032_0717g1792 [Ancylostoma ceylanicum]
MVRRSCHADKGAEVPDTGTTKGRSRMGERAIPDARADRPRIGDDPVNIPSELDLARPRSPWAPSLQDSASGCASLLTKIPIEGSTPLISEIDITCFEY